MQDDFHTSASQNDTTSPQDARELERYWQGVAQLRSQLDESELGAYEMALTFRAGGKS